jgi:5-methylthioadenosine/S-adenosylhomocysteine deaminase
VRIFISVFDPQGQQIRRGSDVMTILEATARKAPSTTDTRNLQFSICNFQFAIPHFRPRLLAAAAALLALLLPVWPGRAAAPPERADLIIRGGTVVTMDSASRVIEDGAVAIVGGRILAVGQSAQIAANYRAARTLDATGEVIMPGLINTHTHVPMVLFRGIADDLVLMTWLQKYIFPAEARNVDEQFVRWGTRLGCLEMILGGTTTYVDMYYFEDAVADETSRAGMRGVLGETLLDFPAPDNKTWESGIAATEKFVKKWKGNSLITPAIAPHAPYTVSTEHMKEAHSFSEHNGVPLVTHIAEDSAEVKLIKERYNASSVAYLDRIGVLDARVIAAHMVWPTADDIKTLVLRSVGVAHCPQSNMKLAAGTAPVPQMLKAGVAVGLGTDGAASNNDLNMWEEMDTAAKLHKLISKDPTVVTAREALEMATIRGAAAIHMDREIGSIEAGKRADVIIVRMDSIHQIPVYNVYSQLVYATKDSDVDTVVIEGKVVMTNRRVLTIDEHSVRAKALEYRDRIRKSLAPTEPSR